MFACWASSLSSLTLRGFIALQWGQEAYKHLSQLSCLTQLTLQALAQQVCFGWGHGDMPVRFIWGPFCPSCNGDQRAV